MKIIVAATLNWITKAEFGRTIYVKALANYCFRVKHV
jgi:hypothetical protein